jgi:hypothetical protein
MMHASARLAPSGKHNDEAAATLRQWRRGTASNDRLEDAVEPASLRFGVFPCGVAGMPDGLATGPPDDLGQIVAALSQLAGDKEPWLIRMYVVWTGAGSTASCLRELGRLALQPWDLDIVLSYKDPVGDVGAWVSFVRSVASEWGERFAALQVTGEPNLARGGDGDFPRVAEALVHGVLEAASVKRGPGPSADIGFAVAAERRPEQSFLWPRVRELGGRHFADALDYAGLDLYLDVFGPPMTPDRLASAAPLALRAFRDRVLEPIGVGRNVPVHICENGWPTGPRRTAERQADVLETVVRSVAAVREELNVTHWELFTLRDADSSVDNGFYQFGVLRDDYAHKPAFDRLARLYRELG